MMQNTNPANSHLLSVCCLPTCNRIPPCPPPGPHPPPPPPRLILRLRYARLSGCLTACWIADDKLQALVYDILPPTTAINDYAIGLETVVSSRTDFRCRKTVPTPNPTPHHHPPIPATTTTNSSNHPKSKTGGGQAFPTQQGTSGSLFAGEDFKRHER